MNSVKITRITSLFIGGILIAMAIGQFIDLMGFTQAIASYGILPQYGRLWAVIFMVMEFLAGVGLISGFHHPRLFSSSANLAFGVFVGWFLFGLVAMQNTTVVNNTGFFGVFFAQPLSNVSQVIIVILGLFSLLLVVQAAFFVRRGRHY